MNNQNNSQLLKSYTYLRTIYSQLFYKMENIKVGFKALEGMKLIEIIELEKKVIKFNTQEKE